MKKILSLVALLVATISMNAQIEVTCAEAAAAMPATQNASTEEVYVVTGYVSSTNGTLSASKVDGTINQQSFWMDDTKGGKNTIQGFYCDLPRGEAALKIGDKVSIIGNITNYNDKPEIKNGTITIIERATKEDIIGVSEALQRIQANNLVSCFVKGKVSKILSAESEVAGAGYLRFWLVDLENANDSIQGYKIFGAGHKKYTSAAEVEFAEGDEVLVYASALYLFNVNIPEINSGYFVRKWLVETTCAEAAAAMPAEGQTTVDTYVVTGYVTYTNGNLINGNQQTFSLADQKGCSHVLECYLCTLPQGANVLKIGDKVKITGKISNYQNHAEIEKGNVTIIERAPAPYETIGVSAAITRIHNDLLDACFVEGRVLRIVSSQENIAKHGDVTYWLADLDNPMDSIQAYYMKGKDNTKYTSAVDIEFKENDVIRVCAWGLAMYNNTIPELNLGYYVQSMETINYLDKDGKPLKNAVVIYDIPQAPEIDGFTFLKWAVLAGDLNDGINVQAIYQANEQTAAPSVYTNPANPSQKLIRNGNVYILRSDHTYTLTGQEVR